MSDLAWYRERRTQRRIKWLGLLVTLFVTSPIAVMIGHRLQSWTDLPAFSYCVQLALAFCFGWWTADLTFRYCDRRWKKWEEKYLKNQGEL